MHTWDKYFYKVCCAIASQSKCLSRKIGAIIVRDKSIVSTGYNGPPRGVSHCSDRIGIIDPRGLNDRYNNPTICPRKFFGYRSGEGLHLCIAAHAEANAIANAARLGVSINDCTMYLNGDITPCKDCMALIINSGIVEVVVSSYNPYDSIFSSLVKQSRVEVRSFDLEAGEVVESMFITDFQPRKE
jgi:dCMP deaminase